MKTRVWSAVPRRAVLYRSSPMGRVEGSWVCTHKSDGRNRGMRSSRNRLLSIRGRTSFGSTVKRRPSPATTTAADASTADPRLLRSTGTPLCRCPNGGSARDRGDRNPKPAQALPAGRGTAWRRLRSAGGIGLWLPRPERRRQEHHHGDPDGAHPTLRRLGVHSRG